MTTPTAKFQQDLDKRLLAIAQTGATAETVSSLMMYTRRVVEDAGTKKTFKLHGCSAHGRCTRQWIRMLRFLES
jgi:hypothetical protein